MFLDDKECPSIRENRAFALVRESRCEFSPSEVGSSNLDARSDEPAAPAHIEVELDLTRWVLFAYHCP
jgi:hypothetical protein